MTSPTGRTLAYLRRAGYTPAVAERWIPRANVRKDLFGIIDIVAIKAGSPILGIQVTTAGNLSTRVAKARHCPALPTWLATGAAFELHGWRQVDGRWRVKIVTLRAGDLEPVVVTALPRKKRQSKIEQGTRGGRLTMTTATTKMLTTEELATIRQRCDEAPPGPWHRAGDSLDDVNGRTFGEAAGGFDTMAHDTWCDALDFLAASREDVPALLAHIELLQAEVQRLTREGRWSERELRIARERELRMLGPDTAPRAACWRCGRRHRDWRVMAHCVFSKADDLGGPGGQYLSLACDDATYKCWPTREQAERAVALMDNTGCGGRCRRAHRVFDLDRDRL